MTQLNFRKKIKPIYWKELDITQSKSVLEYHMFLKKNRYGKIKVQTLAGRNERRDYISKEDSISPTVSTESVLLSFIIDANEEMYATVIYIPIFFIQT